MMMTRKTKSILIVESDPTIHIRISTCISTIENISGLAIAPTLNNALEYLKHEYPDIALINPCLSDGDGFQLLHHFLSQSHVVKWLPIFKKADTKLADKARGLGAYDSLFSEQDEEMIIKVLYNALQY